jgi:hypothetical protein
MVERNNLFDRQKAFISARIVLESLLDGLPGLTEYITRKIVVARGK